MLWSIFELAGQRGISVLTAESPNSFMITAIRYPWRSVKIRLYPSKSQIQNFRAHGSGITLVELTFLRRGSR